MLAIDNCRIVEPPGRISAASPIEETSKSCRETGFPARKHYRIVSVNRNTATEAQTLKQVQGCRYTRRKPKASLRKVVPDQRSMNGRFAKMPALSASLPEELDQTQNKLRKCNYYQALCYERQHTRRSPDTTKKCLTFILTIKDNAEIRIYSIIVFVHMSSPSTSDKCPIHCTCHYGERTKLATAKLG